MVKVLVADDNKEMCGVILDVLKQEGFKVDIVYSGEGALVKLKVQNFDVLILDYRFPGISGLTVLRKARQIRPRTGVIMISGDADHSVRGQAQKLGACDFLDKPFDIYKLVEIIKRFIDNHYTNCNVVEAKCTVGAGEI